MAKQTQKQKNPSSKKKKIIIGTVCGLFGAAAIAAGLAVGLTQCSPTEPKNKFAIYFTPAPDDIDVKINTSVKYIDFGQTFATIKDGVTASKKTEQGEWQFQWWYKDGDAPTKRISDDIALGNDPQVKSLIVHPYFVEPLTKHTVTFSNGGDSSITIKGEKLEGVVEYGTNLQDVLSSFKIVEVIKTSETGERWDFKYWSDEGLEPDPSTPWKKPRNFDYSSQITEDVTLYPYFEKVEPEWIEKAISWERYAGSSSFVSKDFTLPPESESTTSISTTISNFVLSYTDKTILTIPELQEDEEVLIEASVSSGSDEIYQNVDINYNVLPQSEDTAPNKLNIEFTFDNLPISESKMYETPLIFDVTPSLQFGGEKHDFVTIEGITINFSDPWDAPDFEFSKPGTELVTFKTEPGSKQYIITHDDPNEHFTITRAMDNREKLEINALDKNGKVIDNLLVEPIITDNEDGTADIDVAISFNEIQGIFEEHKVNFKLEFVTTFEGSGRESRKVINNSFELVYTPEDKEPYNMVMNDIIIIDGNLGANNISVQIENKAHSYFQAGDYLTVRNLTREEQTSDDNIDVYAPIYFTSPHEKIESEIIGKSDQIALQGKDEAKESLGFKIQFLNKNNIPTEITTYKEELLFDFWDDNPVTNPDARLITQIAREITFIFSPKKWANYTSADWAQYRSIIISMTAVDNTDKKLVQKLGTAWVLSNLSEDEQYYVTSYDVKKDYLELSDTTKYSDFQFGYSNMGAAKQYVANDSTKYIMVDNDINDASLSSTTTDLLISNHQTTSGERGVDWVDESGNPGSRLYWDLTQYDWGLCAPNLAVFKLKPNERGSEDDLKYEQTFKFRSAILNEWAESEGLDPLHKDSKKAGGQVSNLFQTVPDDFSRDGFSYGYTGGFKSKVVTFGSGQNQKTARLVYWTDYTMKAQLGQLTYLGPDMYDNCVGYYDPMFTVTDGGQQKQVYHMCGAFAMTLSSFSKSSYYDDAGRGAMMLLRKYTEDGKNLETPVIAGINWNGGSIWNWPGNITPYFDTWQYGHQQVYNLFFSLTNPWIN